MKTIIDNDKLFYFLGLGVVFCHGTALLCVA